MVCKLEMTALAVDLPHPAIDGARDYKRLGVIAVSEIAKIGERVLKRVRRPDLWVTVGCDRVQLPQPELLITRQLQFCRVLEQPPRMCKEPVVFHEGASKPE